MLKYLRKNISKKNIINYKKDNHKYKNLINKIN